MFCALSILIERLKSEGVVDVFQTVKQLRAQRPAMVQTKVSTSIVVKKFTFYEAISLRLVYRNSPAGGLDIGPFWQLFSIEIEGRYRWSKITGQILKSELNGLVWKVF